MDRNTITGLVLIFAIFIGFSLYNSNKLKNSYESAVSVADSLYEEGDYEEARLQYLKALEFKPGTPEAVNRVNEINQLISPAQANEPDTITEEKEEVPAETIPKKKKK